MIFSDSRPFPTARNSFFVSQPRPAAILRSLDAPRRPSSGIQNAQQKRILNSFCRSKFPVPEPSNTQKRLAAKLFPDEAGQSAFVDALIHPLPYRPALLWTTERPADLPCRIERPEPWQPEFVDRAVAGERPGRHPLHEQGHYYCLDFSSVFTISVLEAIPDPPAAIIDLCASPGGKAIFAWRLFQPGQLAANEVIGKRLGQLIGNLERCRISNARVTRMDTSKLAEACPGSADLAIVDAPCSGQSLAARGKATPGSFHPATINMNANRQRRILANAASIIGPGGWIAYITCTYAEKENEGTVRWLLKRQAHLEPVEVPALRGFESHLSDFPAYRLWPQSRLGAGGFACLLHDTRTPPASRHPFNPPGIVWQSQHPAP